MTTSIESMIEKHTSMMLAGEFEPPEGQCPCCSGKPSTYRLHECRKRSYRYIVRDLVKVTLTLLARWRCPLCNDTFTEHPSFSIPHKRFTRPDIGRLCRKYIEDDRQSYATTVTFKGVSIGYLDEGEVCANRFLQSSTIWRWIKHLCEVFAITATERLKIKKALRIHVSVIYPRFASDSGCI